MSTDKKKQANVLFREGVQAVDELRWEDAEHVFRAALRGEPKNHEVLIQLSLLSARKKRFRLAMAQALQACQFARTKLSKTALYRQWDDRSFRSYLRSLRTLALIQYQSNKSREALATVQELLKLDTKDHLGVSYFLDALLTGKKWKQMERDR